MPAIVISFGMLIYVLLFSTNELYKDEIFFYPVVSKLASLNFTEFWAALKGYSVPIAPLSFVVSGIILKIYNSIYILRVMNIFYFASFSILFIKLVFDFEKIKDYQKYLVVFLLLLNPYIYLIGPHYYTDALYLFLVTILLYFMRFGNKYGAIVTLFFLPLSRQMGIFYLAAVCLTKIISKNYKEALLWGMASIGIIILIYHWQALSPSVEFQTKSALIRAQYGRFRFDYIMFYTSALCFYLAPIVILRMRKIYKLKSFWIGVSLGFLLFIIFTPTRNHYHNLDSLGIYHNLLIKILGKKLLLIPMGILSAVFCGFMATIFIDKNIPMYLRLLIVFFFLFHLNNQIGWEKYLLEALMLFGLSYLYQVEKESI